jgi:hypothetical protein
MRRRDFTIGLLLASTVRIARAQEPAKQHRLAIIAAGPVARIHDPGIRFFQQFFEELRRLGDVEGQNLTVNGYSGGGRPEGYADLAHEVVNRTRTSFPGCSAAAVKGNASADPYIAPMKWRRFTRCCASAM